MVERTLSIEQCGCYIQQSCYDTIRVYIVYCPLHKAAPKMYEALKEMLEANAGCWRKHEPIAFSHARQALALAEEK